MVSTIIVSPIRAITEYDSKSHAFDDLAMPDL